nr:hypothetical protein [Tanacetum cinerariifolium]
MKVKEYLNVTFDETPSSPKTSLLEDDDLVEEEVIEYELSTASTKLLLLGKVKTGQRNMLSDEFVNKPVVENYKAKSSEKEPKVVRNNNDAPIIEEWVSDNEEEEMTPPKIVFLR